MPTFFDAVRKSECCRAASRSCRRTSRPCRGIRNAAGGFAMLPLRGPTVPQATRPRPAKTQRGREPRAPAGENAMLAQLTLMLPDRVGLRHRGLAMLARVIAARPKDLRCCPTICDAVALECEPDAFVPDAAGRFPTLFVGALVRPGNFRCWRIELHRCSSARCRCQSATEHWSGALRCWRIGFYSGGYIWKGIGLYPAPPRRCHFRPDESQRCLTVLGYDRSATDCGHFADTPCSRKGTL